MIEQFSLERVNKSPASFDPQKLLAFQERYFGRLDTKKKVAMVLPYLQKAGLIADPPPCETAPRLTEILAAAGDRLKVAGDILDFDDFFTADDQITFDEKATQKRLKKPEEAIPLLTKFREQLASAESFDAASLEPLLKGFVENEGIKIGQIVHALRVALTGKAVGFGVFETMAVLGKESCLARIDRAIQQVSAS